MHCVDMRELMLDVTCLLLPYSSLKVILMHHLHGIIHVHSFCYCLLQVLPHKLNQRDMVVLSANL